MSIGTISHIESSHDLDVVLRLRDQVLQLTLHPARFVVLLVDNLDDPHHRASLLDVVHGHHLIARPAQHLLLSVRHRRHHAPLSRGGRAVLHPFLVHGVERVELLDGLARDHHRNETPGDHQLPRHLLPAQLPLVEPDGLPRAPGHDAHDDGHRGAILGDHPRRVAVRREHDDARRLDLRRRHHGGRRQRLDGGEGRALYAVLGHGTVQQSLRQRPVIHALLSLLADTRHDLDSLAGVRARGGLAGEHHAVGAVQHGVGHVGSLRSGGAGRGDHGVEHLRRGDDGLAAEVSLPDHHLLHPEDSLQWDLHAEVAARDHDAVAQPEDVVVVAQALVVLNLGDDPDGRTSRVVQDVPDLENVAALADERCGDEVHVVHHTEADDVVEVFFGERGQVHGDAGEVAVLPLADGGAVEALHPHGARVDVGGHDLEHDAPVGHEDVIASLDVASHPLVRHREQVFVSDDGVVGGQCELFAPLQCDGLTVLERTGANLRSFGVQEHRAHLAGVHARLPEVVQAFEVVLVRAVAEVEPGDGHTCEEQLLQVVHGPRARSEGAHDVGLLRGERARGRVHHAPEVRVEQGRDADVEKVLPGARVRGHPHVVRVGGDVGDDGGRGYVAGLSANGHIPWPGFLLAGRGADDVNRDPGLGQPVTVVIEAPGNNRGARAVPGEARGVSRGCRRRAPRARYDDVSLHDVRSDDATSRGRR